MDWGLGDISSSISLFQVEAVWDNCFSLFRKCVNPNNFHLEFELQPSEIEKYWPKRAAEALMIITKKLLQKRAQNTKEKYVYDLVVVGIELTDSNDCCVACSVLRDQFVVIKKNKDFSIAVPMVDVKK